MALNPASIRIASAPPRALVRIAGRAAAERARDFHSAIRRLAATGVGEVFLDLRDCPLLDSTFAGTLTLLAEGHSPDTTPDTPPQPVQFTLVEAKPRVIDALANLEVLALFTVAEPGFDPAIQAPEEDVPLGQVTHAESGRLCLEAHRALMARSDANRSRFSALESALCTELGRNNAPK